MILFSPYIYFNSHTIFNLNILFIAISWTSLLKILQIKLSNMVVDI